MKWLNRERLTIYPRVFLVFYLLFAAALVVSAMRSKTGLTDFLERPLGVDFSQFWVASALALKGHQATVYKLREFIAAQEMVFQVKYPFPWVYPPTGLLLVLPLALLPYLASLGMWLAATITPDVAGAAAHRPAPPGRCGWPWPFPAPLKIFFTGKTAFWWRDSWVGD